MLPIKKMYIDTRFKSADSRSHSDFQIVFPTTLLLPDDTGFYIDDVCIPHAWYTINANVNDQVHFYYGDDGLRSATVPEGIYNTNKLAFAIADEINARMQDTKFYSETELKTNVIRISLTAAFADRKWRIATDAELKTENKTAELSRSMNSLIKNFVSKGHNSQDFVWLHRLGPHSGPLLIRVWLGQLQHYYRSR